MPDFAHVCLILILAVPLATTPAYAAGRSNVFHGYKEKGDSQEEDTSTNGSEASKSDEASSSKASPLVACRDTNAACADWAEQGECDKNEAFMSGVCPIACKRCTPPELNAADYVGELLILETEMGEIRIRTLWDNAPRTAALIMDLAHQAPEAKRACRLYRSEAVPPAEHPDGPPYGLLQGSLAGVLKPPPSENLAKVVPKEGYVAMITGTTEFYISLMDHSSWGGAHSVWGKVENMEVVFAIVAKAAFHELKHPEFGTVMRMMNTEMKMTPRAVRMDEGHEL
uniref:ShKT domain-containing protein n=1 Tax=Chlamydomonas leiostraca TaxID=1034604 RepID=A0A7S0RAT8_9CHLO|mmetsp:Transcript_18227/g.45995  ORF Transcript_18227/g.45995 Transcript_18227/m.45995 type:complete len:284 (+) Transcript_18227:78-929(+)